MKLKILSVILILIALVSACKGKSDKLSPSLVQNPNTASGNVDMSKLPQISFVTNTHDFGDVWHGESLSYSFKFKNTGNSDLLITSAESGCKCTMTKIPDKIVKPGDEGRIDVMFDPTGIIGFQNKVIKVVTNAQPNIVSLYVKANVKTGKP